MVLILCALGALFVVVLLALIFLEIDLTWAAAIAAAVALAPCVVIVVLRPRWIAAPAEAVSSINVAQILLALGVVAAGSYGLLRLAGARRRQQDKDGR